MRILLLATACVATCYFTPDLGAQRGGRDRSSDRTWSFLAKKYDRNGDGKVTWNEYARDKDKFESLDTDDDGKITKADFSTGGRGRGRGAGRRGGRSTRGRSRGGNVPQPGEVAPDFELPIVQKKTKSAKKTKRSKSTKTSQRSKKQRPTVKLSSFKGKKPVALIFGSYT